MSIATLRTKVEQLVEIAQSGGGSGGADLPLVGSEVTDWSYACQGPLYNEESEYYTTSALLGLFIRYLDVSNGEDFSEMCLNNDIVTEISFDHTSTSKGTNFTSAFWDCTSLETISGLDYSGVTNKNNVGKMCKGCTVLKNLYNIKFGSYNNPTTTSNRPFYDCSALENITVKGTIRLKSHLYLNASDLLTVESMMNIINALEDHSDETTTYKIYFGSTNLAKLTAEQMALAENKNIGLA